MRITEHEDRILFLYVACLYQNVPEPAVLLADLGCPAGRRAWDAIWQEDFEVRVPYEVGPSVALFPRAGAPPVVGVATGRRNLKQILRRKLGDSDVTWGLLQPPPGHFFVAAFADGTGTVHAIPAPPPDGP